MSVDYVIDLARHCMSVGLWVTLPLLAIGIVIGIAVAIFQAATQIQESSLQFLPKLVGIGLGLLAFGPWILNKLIHFTAVLISSTASVGR
jgi:flagellar biosynthetic protein FliQ